MAEQKCEDVKERKSSEKKGGRGKEDTEEEKERGRKKRSKEERNEGNIDRFQTTTEAAQIQVKEMEEKEHTVLQILLYVAPPCRIILVK